jgi:hypothetical protein
MSKLHKVYMPRWMSWFGLIVLVPMWLWITYATFLAPPARASDLGLVGWAVMTVVMGGVAVIMYLMGSRRLPAYLIEMDEDGD